MRENIFTKPAAIAEDKPERIKKPSPKKLNVNEKSPPRFIRITPPKPKIQPASLIKLNFSVRNTKHAHSMVKKFLTGGLALIIIGASFGGKIPHVSVGGAFMLLYLAFLSACAFTLQGFLLKYNPVSKVAVYKSTNPLFGAVFSAIILSESDQLLSFYTLIAIVLVCLGIFIINKFGEKRKKT